MSYGPTLEDMLSESSGALVAYDPKQGKVKWTHNVDTFNMVEFTTAAGLVFMPEVDEKDYAGTIETFFQHLMLPQVKDFLDGQYNNIAASSGCISYEIGGKQYIAIAVGGAATNEWGVMITNHGDIYVPGYLIRLFLCLNTFLYFLFLNYSYAEDLHMELETEKKLRKSFKK